MWVRKQTMQLFSAIPMEIFAMHLELHDFRQMIGIAFIVVNCDVIYSDRNENIYTQIKRIDIFFYNLYIYYVLCMAYITYKFDGSRYIGNIIFVTC